MKVFSEKTANESEGVSISLCVRYSYRTENTVDKSVSLFLRCVETQDMHFRRLYGAGNCRNQYPSERRGFALRRTLGHAHKAKRPTGSAGRRKLKRFGSGSGSSEDRVHSRVGKLAIVLLNVCVRSGWIRMGEEARDSADPLSALVDAHSGRVADHVAVDHIDVESSARRKALH